MAAEEMEAVQKAMRKTDYDSLSDEDDDRSETSQFSEPLLSSSSTRQRARATATPQRSTASSFDPYAQSQATSVPSSLIPPKRAVAQVQTSILDNYSFDEMPPISDNETKVTTSSIPGAAGYLEMEEEPPRNLPAPVNLSDEPIKTSSGLLLTHRKSPNSTQAPPPRFERSFELPSQHARGAFRNVQKDYFEVEKGHFGWSGSGSNHGRNSMPMLQARRFLSYVKIWVVISACFLAAATGVFFHSFGHSAEVVSANVDSATESTNIQKTVTSAQESLTAQVPDQIILMPMENISELAQQKQQEDSQPLQLGFHKDQTNDQHGARRVLHELRQEFENWAAEHGKAYHSQKEKEHRFNIWSQNHHRTIEKNRRHGPCKLTKQAVFGSNHFKDVSPEEFKAKYLTGYQGPKGNGIQEELESAMGRSMDQRSKHRGQVLNPNIHKRKMHDDVKRRLLQQQPVMGRRSAKCQWYDLSCWLRWIWQSAGVQFGTIVGTMEPKYDADAFPNAVDWRDLGAVSEMRTQGDCGACWAITAVETVESAHYIATGNLYDLAESEVIACQDSCEMCSGGWPQNAFEWVMDHGGLPLYEDFPYDGSTLMQLTLGLEGTSDYYTEDTVMEYRYKMCPADGGNSGSHDSGDSYWEDGKDNNDYGDYSNQGRYGNIKGYGYATDRCVCYSDGSGCDCDSQDEDLAVANIATYGPAVVCLEASTWQDYSGGIMTSDVGCGSAFLDMNHCVQAVGYAFTTDDEAEDDDEKSGSQSGSQDSAEREGYWIIRNQWGNSWGMNGYAYVAMGDNTCGVLNDMTQAYL